jgi:hypothetical protein
MAKNKGRGDESRRNTMAALEDTDPMTREELLEAFGRSGSDPETVAVDRRDRERSRPTDEQVMRG